jgi:glyoxylase-like metal-dependent hydrolase (beta-lactamase superfamily II)
MSIEETRIYPINTGWCEADHGTYMFLKGEGGKKIDITVMCYYVDTGEHKIMVDTGLPDAERASKYHHACEKRGCLQSPDALREMGIEPEEIDVCIFTHLHWDHCSNMKAFKNARYVATAEELRWAHNPLPPYYRSYESPILGLEAPFVGCHFEVVEGEAEVVPGVSVFPTPGHTPGHQAVQVETSAGSIVLVGDSIFLYRNFEPRVEEHWRYWIQQRLVNILDGWRSMEEIDRRADFILPCHDDAVLEHPVYPYEGMDLREKREPVSGAPFYFAGI